MGYNKQVTNRIVELWALGFTAEESVKTLRDDHPSISLATIYRHRHNLTAQHLIDELLRRQDRAIFKADTDDPELGMKYRNELLKILLPQKILSYAKSDVNLTEIQKIIHLHMWRPGDESADNPNSSIPISTIRETSKLPQRQIPDKT